MLVCKDCRRYVSSENGDDRWVHVPRESDIGNWVDTLVNLPCYAKAEPVENDPLVLLVEEHHGDS